MSSDKMKSVCLLAVKIKIDQSTSLVKRFQDEVSFKIGGGFV